MRLIKQLEGLVVERFGAVMVAPRPGQPACRLEDKALRQTSGPACHCQRLFHADTGRF